MNDFVRNRFKLETQGSQTASEGSIVTFLLLESSLIHLPSIRFFFDVTTTSSTSGNTTVYGKLPADASSLISKLEIYIGGVQVQNGTAEYNTIARILKLSQGNAPRDQSVDRAISHGAIDTSEAVWIPNSYASKSGVVSSAKVRRPSCPVICAAASL